MANMPVAFFGAGDAPAAAAAVTPFSVDMPTGYQPGDLIVAVFGIKGVGTPAPTVPVGSVWQLGPVSSVFASGVAAGTGVGQQIIRTAYAVVPNDGSWNGVGGWGFQFGATTPNNVNGRAFGFRYNASGYSSPAWDPLVALSWARDTAANGWGTPSSPGNLPVDAGDYLFAHLLVADDTNRAATPNLALSPGAGASLGTLVDVGHDLTTTGGDSAFSHFGAPVATGPSTSGQTCSLTGAATETGGGMFLRIRATGTLAPSSPMPAGIPI